MLESREGRRSQAVQITTMLGDSVVGAHRLDGEACGGVRRGTRTLLVAAGALVLGGLAAVLASSLGAGASLLLLGTGLGVFAATKAARERSTPHFLVGEGRDAHLPLPAALLPAPCYPLVLSTPGGYHLLFGQGMEGIVEDGGRVMTLRDLVTTGKAWPASELPARAVPLPERGRACVRIGESTVIVEAVEAGAAMRGKLLGGLDQSGLLSNVCSFSAHAVVLGLVFALPPAGATLSIDSFNLDSRGVKYILRPQEPPKTDVPTWLTRHQQDRGGGPSTKGTPGRVGNPRARRQGGRFAVKGTSPVIRPAKEWARLVARDFGILGVMGRRQGGPFAHFSGDEHALGNDALDAMGGLIGNTVGENDGTGGLGPIGVGRMGGGDARDIIAGPGIRTSGDIHLPPGGPGKLRDHSARAPRQIVAEPPKVTGGLDKEIIRREIKKHLNEIRYCYSKELPAKPELQGRVVVNFTIASTGKVVASKIQATTLGDGNVEGCITQAFYRWSFPKTADQGMVVVSYPFIFHPVTQ